MKWDIIKTFSIKKKGCFSYQDVLKEFPGRDPSYLSKTLTDMVRKGMLLKLSRDVYHIIPLSADPQSYSPDTRLIARCVMKGRDYYIGYATAMQILGLTDQTDSGTVVVTKRQVQPSFQMIAGKEFHFINHTYSKFFGYKEIWVTTQEKAMVSDLEKTIVDALSKPGLCGGIKKVGKAIYRSRKRTDQERLFFYLSKNRSNAAKKRYLYLSSALEMRWTSDHERMLREAGSGISLLDPSEPDMGVKNYRFGLKINIEANTLKDHL